jgi:hypothetical protein
MLYHITHMRACIAEQFHFEHWSCPTEVPGLVMWNYIFVEMDFTP